MQGDGGLGAGQRGLCSLLAVRAGGAGTVILTDVSAAAHKLALARELGADATVEVDRWRFRRNSESVTGTRKRLDNTSMTWS